MIPAAGAPARPGYGRAVPEALRLLRSPRWVALTALGLVVIVAFGLLSRWQWERAHRDDLAAAEAADPAPVALGSVLAAAPLAGESYGRRVAVTGTYLPAAQRLVPRGEAYWVLTPLRTEHAVVPVVRGTVSSAVAPPPPTGTVEVTGRVEPYEGDPGPQPGDDALPPDQLPRLTRATVAGALQGIDAAPEPVGGWVALTAQDPASDLPAAPSPSAPEAGGSLRWQNASYAAQWVLFAAFVVFLWSRWFRDDLRSHRAAGSAPADAS